MNNLNVRFVALAGIVLVASAAISASPAAAAVDLSAPSIVYGSHADPLEQLAARELWRYLARVSQKPGTVATDDAATLPPGITVLIDVAGGNRLAAEIEKREQIAVDAAALGEEGFRWKVVQCQGKPALLLAAAKPAGVLHGAYALLEKLGFGFYLGGDAFPAAGSPMAVEPSLDEIHKPAFAIRGSLPWGNLLDSYWDLDDLKFIYDQLSKQRCNFVGFHQYDHEPFCAYTWQGKLVGAQPFFSTLTPHLGTVPLHTYEFGFGTGDYFDRDPFTSRTVLDGKDREDRIRRAMRMFAESIDYAHARGIKVCLGFELIGDPTDPQVVARLEARIAAMLRAYPQLDYVWYFQPEAAGLVGSNVPKGSALERLVREEGKPFEYLLEPKIDDQFYGPGGSPQFDGPKRLAEAVRFSHYFNLAYRITKKLRPDLPVAINGWGGDRWNYMNDFFFGLDKTLPKDVIFSAQDNPEYYVDYSHFTPELSRVYGKLPPDRRCWPIPWWKCDDARNLWNPQANAKNIAVLCRDALAKKCEGVIGVYWSARLVEEAAGFQARFAWNPQLTYDAFYDDFAARCFGKKWAPAMSRNLRNLESLGHHWTGAGGMITTGAFDWFPPGVLPKPENMKKLEAIRAETNSIRQAMIADGRLEGIERIDWLLNTIDWLLRFDRAALQLMPGGPVEKLLKDAEGTKNDPVTAQSMAQAARQRMNESGFREAIQTFPKKMSLVDDFGDFAYVQTICYTHYLRMHRRIEAILGSLPEDLAGPPVPPGTPPLIVGRQPPSLVASGRAIPVGAAVIGGKPITSSVLHYHSVGADAWKTAPMKNTFRSTYTADIPAAAVKWESLAIEWFVEARDEAGRVAYWPKNYPSVVWSATIVPDRSHPAAQCKSPIR